MSRRFLTVNTVIVAFTILFYTGITQYINPSLSTVPGLGPLTGLMASIGFYVSAFRGSLWLYNKFLIDKVELREAITGDWFYKLQIKGRTMPRYGICKFSRHDGSLVATGIHYNAGSNTFTSRFTSDHILIDGNNVTIIYTSVGVDEDIFMRRGVFFLSTEDLPPRRMYGIWTDVIPNTNLGDIVMQRRDNNTDKILVSIGYPLAASALDVIVAPANQQGKPTQEAQ